METLTILLNCSVQIKQGSRGSIIYCKSAPVKRFGQMLQASYTNMCKIIFNSKA